MYSYMYKSQDLQMHDAQMEEARSPKSRPVTFHVPAAGEKQDQYDTKQMQLVPVPGGNLAYR